MAAQQAIVLPAEIVSNILLFLADDITQPTSDGANLELSRMADVDQIWAKHVEHLKLRYAHSTHFARTIDSRGLTDPVTDADEALGKRVKSMVVDCVETLESDALTSIGYPRLDSLYMKRLGNIFNSKTFSICAPQLRYCKLDCSVFRYPGSLEFLKDFVHLEKLVISPNQDCPTSNDHKLYHKLVATVGPRLKSLGLTCLRCYKLKPSLLRIIMTMRMLEDLEVAVPFMNKDDLDTLIDKNFHSRLRSLTCSIGNRDTLWYLLELTPLLSTIDMTIYDPRSEAISTLKLRRDFLHSATLRIIYSPCARKQWGDSLYRTCHLSEILDVLNTCVTLEHFRLKVSIERPRCDRHRANQDFVQEICRSFVLTDDFFGQCFTSIFLKTLYLDLKDVANSQLTTRSLTRIGYQCSMLEELFLPGCFDLTGLDPFALNQQWDRAEDARPLPPLFPELKTLTLDEVQQCSDELNLVVLQQLAPKLGILKVACNIRSPGAGLEMIVLRFGCTGVNED